MFPLLISIKKKEKEKERERTDLVFSVSEMY